MSSTKPQVPKWLANASFEDLFLRSESTPLVGQPNGGEASLEAIADSPDLSPKIRVLAHELLIEAGHAPDPSLAETYCQTLPDVFLHNAWGMPGRYIERLGKTVVAFGTAALPCLVDLFADQRPLGYFGSEEPTLSEQMRYRVGDLAAYLASQIAGIPYRDDPETETRDVFIRKLMTELRG
ncbi:MAG TPA: hypothetical protein VGW76_00150 [Pyrinomonadaceae bacterium]|nr:hypothetical protein [Pyrinomonadaceae bacterium]